MIPRHFRSNIVAYLALLIAMSGTSYAAASVANGSVTTRKLAQNAVTSPKIRNEGVKSIDIRNNNVKSSDLKDNSVNSSDLQDGSVSSVDVKDRSLARGDLATAAVPGKADVFVSQVGGVNPVAAPDAPTQHPFAFTLPRDEKVLLRFFAGDFGVTCGGPVGQVGLYIDGTPVAGTLTNVPSGADAGAVELIAAVVLQEGAHTVSTGEDCPAGTYAPRTQTRITWEVAQLAR